MISKICSTYIEKVQEAKSNCFRTFVSFKEESQHRPTYSIIVLDNQGV